MTSNAPKEATIPVELFSTDHEGSSEQDTTSFDIEDPAAKEGKIDLNRKLKPFILLTAACAALGKSF